METVKTVKKFDVRRLVFTALMSALAIVLAELLKFGVPVMPFFIKFDFSDSPAMLASLTMGPVSGVFVCVIKNVWGCFTTSTGCVGELQNFILGVGIVLPAGIITHKKEKFSRAVVGCLVGAVTMALVSFPANYFIIYPLFTKMMPMNVIIGFYQKILPSADTLAKCRLIFNVPFTFVKGFAASVFSVVLYKKLRPVFSSMYKREGV